jgi:two-component system KDP operon response regulator KdpE
MHILILAATSDVANKMQAAVSDVADRCTVVAAWADVFSQLGNDRPDLILVERFVLSQTELSVLSSLAEPGSWPPLLFVDALASGAATGIVVAQRVSQEASYYYQIGDLHIDTRKRRAKLGERWVTLPPIQYRLLLTLAKRAGEVIDYRELLRAVWGYEAEESEARELVKVHIRQIRRRLGLDPEKYHYIRSVRGFGYMLTSPDED